VKVFSFLTLAGFYFLESEGILFIEKAKVLSLLTLSWFSLYRQSETLHLQDIGWDPLKIESKGNLFLDIVKGNSLIHRLVIRLYRGGKGTSLDTGVGSLFIDGLGFLFPYLSGFSLSRHCQGFQ
jgi:hypothetical protein